MADRMTDEQTVDVDDQVVDETTNEDDDDFEILVEGRDEIPSEEPADEGPSKEELLAELEDLRRQQQQASSQLGDRQTLESGFDKLSQLLEKQQSPQPQSEPSESWEDLKKRIGKNFYDDPTAAIEEMLRYAVQTEVVPAFRQTQDAVGRTAVATSKQMAASNPTNKMILEKFGNEVEEAVKGLPPSPDVYEKACQQVGYNHLTDLVAMQVEAAQGGEAATPHRPTSNVRPTASSPSRGKTASPKRRVLTASQRDWADKNGLTYQSAWEYFNDK